MNNKSGSESDMSGGETWKMLGCGLCGVRDYSANCIIHGDEKRKEILMQAGADEFIRAHHNPIVTQKNEEIAHLQKLCEEQSRELDHFKKSGIIEIAVRNPAVAEYMNHWEGRALKAESQLSSGAIWHGPSGELHHGGCVCKRCVAVNKQGVPVADLLAKVEEQKGEIERLKEAHADCEKPNWTDPELVSQLATQTERVMVMREALEKAHKWACKYPLQGEPSAADMDASDDVRFACQQALNQESLGDGGKGE